MADFNRRMVLMAIVLLLCIISSPVSKYHSPASGNSFQLYGYSYKSSVGELYIYPGSKNVDLIISILYNGNQKVYVYGACAILPQGFSASRGYSLCTTAELPNGSSVYLLNPGSVISFRYRIDVAEDLSPGDYTVSIRIRYSDSIDVYESIIDGIVLTVSPYPNLDIEVVDWYWSPDAYPGSEEVYLSIVLRNRGNAYIVRGNCILKLPSDVFIPSSIRFTIGGLDRNLSTTVTLGPISISPQAKITTYTATISMEASLSTNDNVIYTKNTTLTFNLTINPAPIVNIKLIDYGFTDIRVYQGSVRSRLYVTLLNQDFTSIRSTIAYFRIISGAKFVNTSDTSIYIHRTVLNYGDSYTLYSDYILLDITSNIVTVELKLVLFGDKSGAEFWSIQTYMLRISIEKPKISMGIAKVYWDRGKVYPGTKNAALAIVLENLDVVDIKNAIVTINLPSGVFYPETLTVPNIVIPSGDRAVVLFNPISISPHARAGTYTIVLIVSAIASTPTGSFFNTTLTLIATVDVAEPLDSSGIEIVSYSWTTDKAYLSMVNTGIDLYLRNSNPFYSIVNPELVIYLPPGILFNNGNKSKVIALEGRYEYGQIMFIRVQGIDIYVAEEGSYPVILEFKYLAIDVNGKEFWRRETLTLVLNVLRPTLNMTVIDAGWINRVVTGLSSRVSLYITLQSFSLDTIKTVAAIIEQDSRVLTNLRSNNIISAVSQAIGYGDIITIVFDDLELTCIDCTKLDIVITISAVKVVGSSLYNVEGHVKISVPITEGLRMFNVVAVNVYHRASPAPLLPTSRSININVVIANMRAYDVVWIKPVIDISNTVIVRLNSIEGNCINGIPRGGTCNLVLNVDVDPYAKPGVYTVLAELTYGIQTNGAITISRENILIPIVVADYNYYRPMLRPLTWYWGAQTPIRVYPGFRGAPLSITIVNDGVYPVEGVEVYLNPRNNTVKTVIDRVQCASVLVPNAYCTAIFSVDIDVDAKGVALFDVMIKYIFTEFGANISNTVLYTISLRIDEYAAGKGLKLIEYAWINEWPVYPATENATYIVRLYNSWPYRISGLTARLILPKGFISKGADTATTYLPGPIPSLQPLELSFEITIGNDVSPGRYAAKLELEYVVESGAPHILVKEVLNVYLQVYDISRSISLVHNQWLFSAPEPKTYGAILVIGIRNDHIPVIRGATLELYTDPQILISDTNTTYGVIPATRSSPETLLQTVTQYPRIQQYIPIQEYISQMVRGSGGEYSYGEIMYFYIRLNLLMDLPGVYVMNAFLNLIDQWNNIRRIPIEIPIHVVGTAKVINVESVRPIKIVNSTANLTIAIYNIGSAPIYNVYVYIVPQTPIVIPSGGPRYLEAVYPYEPAYASFTLIYNPIALFTGMTAQYIRYTSAIFTVAILYRDAIGTTRYLNLSLAVPLEPFVELKVMSLKANLINNILTVSGVVVNYGLATARSIEVALIDNNGRTLSSSFLGDLDPASQYAFRVEANIDKVSPPYTLRLLYRDEYNVIRYLDTVITTIQELPQERVSTPSLSQDHGELSQRLAVTVLIAIFLTLIGLIIYRYVNKHVRKLGEKVEV